MSSLRALLATPIGGGDKTCILTLFSLERLLRVLVVYECGCQWLLSTHEVLGRSVSTVKPSASAATKVQMKIMVWSDEPLRTSPDPGEAML